MRSLMIVSLLAFSLFGAELQKNAYVDPKRFSGLWYEIARTYNAFEKDCVAPTVEYIYREDNSYKVINRCFRHTIGGELITYTGKARPQDGRSMVSMDMTYFWIFTQTYEVKYLKGYETAVITDKDLEQVWIMHRNPFLSQEIQASILAMLEQHMDVKELIFSPQDPQGRYQ